MIKSQFIIYGGDKKEPYKIVDGFILQNGNEWFGIHKTLVDQKQVWSVTFLRYGLRYKTFPTKKAAEEAAKGAEILSVPDSLMKTNEIRDNYRKLEDTIKEQYTEKGVDGNDIVKVYYRMYEEEW